MSEEYIFFKNRFKRRRKDMLEEIDRRTRYTVRATDVMCLTWYIKQSLDMMRSDVDEHILCWNILSTRECKVLYKYIKLLEDYMWNRLYDMAGQLEIPATCIYSNQIRKEV